MKINTLALIIATTLVSTSALANGWHHGGGWGNGGSNPTPPEPTVMEDAVYTDTDTPTYLDTPANVADNYSVTTLNESENVKVKIYQESADDGSTAIVDLNNAEGTTKGDFKVKITQNDGNNWAKVKTVSGYQSYDDAKISVTQSGSENATKVLLDGGTDDATVKLTSSGNSNGIDVNLFAADRSTVIGTVTGDNNVADIDIYGSGSVDNNVTFTQTGDTNIIDVDIDSASDNIVTLNQTAYDSFAGVYVDFTYGNTINVLQTAGDFAAVTVSGGSGNTVIVNQQ